MKAAEDFLADQGITEETLAGDYAEVCLAMRLYSDQQNKELRERADELAIELHETIIKHDELFDEAERLTKEVDELKLRLSGKTFFNPFEEENTRLRELLIKCKQFIKENDWDEELIESIDNALNHKP